MPPVDALRRKLTIRAHGRTLVLLKRAEESGEHVVQKAVLWVRYLGVYPALRVEQKLPFASRFKPDLYALDATQQAVVFWGECGVTSRNKLAQLLRRHTDTHFVFSRWGGGDRGFASLIDDALTSTPRSAPVELIVVPPTAFHWLADGRELVIPDDALAVRRWEASAGGGASRRGRH